MKHALVIALVGMVFMTTSACQKSEEDLLEAKATTINFDCVNAQADKAPALADAQKNIVGSWTLKRVASMMPTTSVPNIEIIFRQNGSYDLIKDGKVIGTDTYKIKEESMSNSTWLTISATQESFSNQEYNIVRGSLRVCANEMLIDNGMAFDAPGFYFARK
jgi:hypothetical protein